MGVHYYCRKKKIIRDEKSIGRANKELVKLEKQADRSTLDCAKASSKPVSLFLLARIMPLKSYTD